MGEGWVGSVRPNNNQSPEIAFKSSLAVSWASLEAQLVKRLSCLQCGRPGFSPWVGKTPWRRAWLPTPVFWPGEFHGLQPARLLHPWDFPGKNTTVGCHFLLQEIFPTQGLNLGLPPCRQTIYHLSQQGSPSSVDLKTFKTQNGKNNLKNCIAFLTQCVQNIII